MKQPIDSARRLLSLAERDVNAFEVLKNQSGIHPETVCFHAQQAVEKIIKAVLIANNIAPSRTHDLEALAYAVLAIPIELPVTLEDLIKLNPYAVTYRYEEADIATMSTALANDIVQAIRLWGKKYIV